MSTKKVLLIVGGCFLGLVLLFAGSMVFAKLLFSDKDKSFVSGPGIGLVEVKGMIVDSTEPIRQLRHFAKKDSVKAVVLRIDSPGGVVGPSRKFTKRCVSWLPKRKLLFPWVALLHLVVITLQHLPR